MNVINVAEWASGVTVLGPGKRIVIWAQGCVRCCSGCWSPEWRSLETATLVEADAFARMLAANEGDCGVTISGGEPMLQAAGFLELWQQLKMLRPEWTLLIFSGYYRREILQENHSARVELLNTADAYLGGPYIEALNNGRGLRGSSNKEVYLPPGSRFTPEEVLRMREGTRCLEWQLRENHLLQIGVPSPSGCIESL